MKPICVFIIFPALVVSAPYESGQYEPDSSGQWVPDNSGQYVPDNSGQWVPDNSGQYVPDNSGQWVPDTSRYIQRHQEQLPERRSGLENRKGAICCHDEAVRPKVKGDAQSRDAARTLTNAQADSTAPPLVNEHSEVGSQASREQTQLSSQVSADAQTEGAAYAGQRAHEKQSSLAESGKKHGEREEGALNPKSTTGAPQEGCAVLALVLVVEEQSAETTLTSAEGTTAPTEQATKGNQPSPPATAVEHAQTAPTTQNPIHEPTTHANQEASKTTK